MKLRYIAPFALVIAAASAAAIVSGGGVSRPAGILIVGASPGAPIRSGPVAMATIRSALYPANWLPVGAGGSKDGSGRFLQDFSYAGYRMGDYAIPTSFNGGLNRTVSTANGENTYSATTNPNSTDATPAIQNAIDEVCSLGGGVVNIPSGAYRIRPQGSDTAAIRLTCNNIILRGSTNASGVPNTYLFNDEANMRNKRVIFAGTTDDSFIWYTSEVSTPTTVAAVTDPTRVIQVGDASAFAVNEPIVIRTEPTAAFKALHGMGPGQNGCDATQGCWYGVSSSKGQLYYRTVKAKSGTTLTLDAPIRYILDPTASGNNPRAYRTSPAAYNIGIENLQIGMRENTKSGLTDANLEVPGTAAYETSGAQAIRFASVKASWARNVRSYKPGANANNFHLASVGVALSASSRNISVIDCQMRFPKNRLGGGNGYLFVTSGMDNLIQNAIAEAGRHNFMFAGASSTGNVILGGSTINSEAWNDFHVALSHANLVDGQTVIGYGWQTFNRGNTSNGAGVTSTQSVFWNLNKGDTSSGHLIYSNQFGHGYIIGTRGNTATVLVSGPSFLTPTDWVEALNTSDTLEPASLYVDQKAKRDASSSY